MENNNDIMSDSIRRENIRMHDRDSLVYDFRHPYMRDKYLQNRFVVEMSLVTEMIGKRSRTNALDCGVGTGNLSLRYLESGWYVTSIDISPGMLKVLREKVKEDFLPRLTLVESDVDLYLAHQKNKFDLISFGATLHHLPDYLKTVSLACNALVPGGILYITGEPSKVDGLSRAEFFIMRLDELFNIFYKILFRPSMLRKFIVKVFGFGIKDDEINESLAEFHANSGIDQDACLGRIKEHGFTVERFEHYGLLGFKLTRIFAYIFRIEQKSQFMIIAQKCI